MWPSPVNHVTLSVSDVTPSMTHVTTVHVTHKLWSSTIEILLDSVVNTPPILILFPPQRCSSMTQLRSSTLTWHTVASTMPSLLRSAIHENSSSVSCEICRLFSRLPLFSALLAIGHNFFMGALNSEIVKIAILVKYMELMALMHKLGFGKIHIQLKNFLPCRVFTFSSFSPSTPPSTSP